MPNADIVPPGAITRKVLFTQGNEQVGVFMTATDPNEQTYIVNGHRLSYVEPPRQYGKLSEAINARGEVAGVSPIVPPGSLTHRVLFVQGNEAVGVFTTASDRYEQTYIVKGHQLYTVQPPGQYGNLPEAVNARGQVAGEYPGFNGATGYLWSKARGTQTFTVSNVGGSWIDHMALSANGTVTGRLHLGMGGPVESFAYHNGHLAIA